jgi:3-methyladenine DNA glycosylase Mpg
MDLTGKDIYFVADPGYEPLIHKTKRVGVDYARQWKDRLLRFIDVRSPTAARLRY